MFAYSQIITVFIPFRIISLIIISIKNEIIIEIKIYQSWNEKPHIFVQLKCHFLQQQLHMKFRLLIVAILVLVSNSQKCRNHADKEVDWFVILITPKSAGDNYHYFDSESKSGFTYSGGRPDVPNHPIYNTIKNMSSSIYQIIAWNDQAPNGSTSSTKAHSKTVVGYNLETQTGIVLVHSMPLYPAIQQKWINETIADSQRVYGQHFFCFNSGATTKQILIKASIMTPYYYANSNKDNFNMTTSDLFQFTNLDIGATRLKIIFKNGKKNGSIIEDGLTQMLGSDLIAQTWGRPIMAPWCGDTYRVGNAVSLKFNDSITWKQTQDHSKWVIPASDRNNFVCFGDVNRMESQFKRGGAYYCIENALLKKSMNSIISDSSLLC